jgi:hypothetical protein
MPKLILFLRISWTLALIGSLPFACVAPMMFDDEAARDVVYTENAAIGHLLLPITLLVAIIVGPILERKGLIRDALIVLLAPFVHVL